jgi:hypothetical protein
MVTCKQYEQNGAQCVLCVDANGVTVRQGCSTPGSTDPGTMPPPPGSMMPPPPPPPPPVSCQTYQNATSVCIICVDRPARSSSRTATRLAPAMR